MTPTMVACTMAMIDKWATFVEDGQAIDVQKEMKDLTADIIAHTAFGSSFAEGTDKYLNNKPSSISWWINLSTQLIFQGQG